MNNQNKTSIFEKIAYAVFYALLFPFVIVFTVLGAVVGSVFLVVYIIYQLIAWPFSEIKERKRKRKVEAQRQAPELIEAIDVEDLTHE